MRFTELHHWPTRAGRSKDLLHLPTPGLGAELWNTQNGHWCQCPEPVTTPGQRIQDEVYLSHFFLRRTVLCCALLEAQGYFGYECLTKSPNQAAKAFKPRHFSHCGSRHSCQSLSELVGEKKNYGTRAHLMFSSLFLPKATILSQNQERSLHKSWDLRK